MGLRVIERFSVLTEAQVARTALESAGIPAFVSDEFYGHMDWPLQTGLQGFRLSVPSEDFDEACQIILEARRDGAEGLAQTPSDIPRPPTGSLWVALALFLGLSFGGAGFLVLPVQRKPSVSGVGCLAVMVALAVLLWLSLFSFGLFTALFSDWGVGLFALALLLWWMLAGSQRAPISRQD